MGHSRNYIDKQLPKRKELESSKIQLVLIDRSVYMGFVLGSLTLPANNRANLSGNYGCGYTLCSDVVGSLNCMPTAFGLYPLLRRAAACWQSFQQSNVHWIPCIK